MIWYLAELDDSQNILINGEDEQDARSALIELYASRGYTTKEDAETATLDETDASSVQRAKSKLKKGRYPPFRAVDQYNDGKKSDAVMWEKRANQAGSKGLYRIPLN